MLPTSLFSSVFLYFWFSLGCHRKGSGRFLPAHAEFAILLSLLSVTVQGLLEGDLTVVPAALCSVGAVHHTGVLAAQ